jgi:hypothetical protein
MPTRVPRERESKVLRSIRIRLRHRFGIRLWRRNTGAMREGERFIRFASPGQADLWGFDRTARHWELEVKAPGKKPTPLQIAWLKEVTRLGAVGVWTDSANDAERIAEAVLAGGRVVWTDKDFHVEMPS